MIFYCVMPYGLEYVDCISFRIVPPPPKKESGHPKYDSKLHLMAKQGNLKSPFIVMALRLAVLVSSIGQKDLFKITCISSVVSHIPIYVQTNDYDWIEIIICMKDWLQHLNNPATVDMP